MNKNQMLFAAALNIFSFDYFLLQNIWREIVTIRLIGKNILIVVK